MPDTYEIQAPDGSTLEIQSDGPPTPAIALRAMRAYGDAQAAAAQKKADAGSTLGSQLTPENVLHDVGTIGSTVGGAVKSLVTEGWKNPLGLNPPERQLTDARINEIAKGGLTGASQQVGADLGRLRTTAGQVATGNPLDTLQRAGVTPDMAARAGATTAVAALTPVVLPNAGKLATMARSGVGGGMAATGEGMTAAGEAMNAGTTASMGGLIGAGLGGGKGTAIGTAIGGATPSLIRGTGRLLTATGRAIQPAEIPVPPTVPPGMTTTGAEVPSPTGAGTEPWTATQAPPVVPPPTGTTAPPPGPQPVSWSQYTAEAPAPPWAQYARRPPTGGGTEAPPTAATAEEPPASAGAASSAEPSPEPPPAAPTGGTSLRDQLEASLRAAAEKAAAEKAPSVAPVPDEAEAAGVPEEADAGAATADDTVKDQLRDKIETLNDKLNHPFGDRDDFSGLMETANEDLSVADLQSAYEDLLKVGTERARQQAARAFNKAAKATAVKTPSSEGESTIPSREQMAPDELSRAREGARDSPDRQPGETVEDYRLRTRSRVTGEQSADPSIIPSRRAAAIDDKIDSMYARNATDQEFRDYLVKSANHPNNREIAAKIESKAHSWKRASPLAHVLVGAAAGGAALRQALVGQLQGDQKDQEQD